MHFLVLIGLRAFFVLASTGSANGSFFYFLKIFIASCPKGCENLQKTSPCTSFADLPSVLSQRGYNFFSLKKSFPLP